MKKMERLPAGWAQCCSIRGCTRPAEFRLTYGVKKDGRRSVRTFCKRHAADRDEFKAAAGLLHWALRALRLGSSRG